MSVILQPELSTILAQGIGINIIHTIVLNQDIVVTISIRVTYHSLNLSLCTMIVAFVVTPIRTFIYIAVQIDRLCHPVCLRNMDAYYLCSIHIHHLHIAISLAISLRVLSVTSCPRIFSVAGAIPKNSQPPAVLRKAQAECIPSFNSPVVFFTSNVRVSSPREISFTSSIVIITFILLLYHKL